MNILLVEDNPGDQALIKEAFEEAAVDCQLNVVTDGMEAIRYLHREKEHITALRPDLIILDLNLPLKDGREVLMEIKKSPDIGHIPVLILSNSSAKKDICDSYRLNASVYVGKPSEYDDFLHFARMIKEFWIKCASYCPA